MRMFSSSALALVLVTGCTFDSSVQGVSTDDGVDISPSAPDCGDETGGGSGSGAGAVCLDRQPKGDLIWSYQREAFYYLGAVSMAVDSRDETVYSLAGTTSFTGPHTTTKLSTFGTLVYQRSFGGAVAADARGFAYVSGPFGTAMNFGLGTQTPAGIGSVFLAKLDGLGNTVWARDVPFPTASTQVEQGTVSLAVTADGNLFAVSTMLGTIVLDAQGRTKYRTPYFGAVKFTADGRLVIHANNYNSDGNSRAVVLAFDEDGCILWRHVLGDDTVRDGATIARDLAIDADGNIILVGEIYGHALIFGEDFVATPQPYTSDISLAIAGYIIKLAPDGSLRWKQFDDSVDLMIHVAADALGSIVTTGAHYTSAGAHADAFLDKHAADGHVIWQKTGVFGATEGAGNGVATDSCGNVLWAATALVANVGQSAYVLKLAL